MTDAPTQREEARVQRFIEQFGSALETSGLARMPSRMLAALLTDEDGRMTSTDVQDALACSPAAVSAASQYLTRLGCLRREREPGTRRDVFVLPDGVWEDILLSKDSVFKAMQDLIREGMTAVGEGTDAELRLRMVHELYEVLDSVMEEAVERWQVRKAELLAERD